MVVLKKRVRNLLIILTICDSFESIAYNSRNSQKQNKAEQVFEAEVFSYKQLKFQKISLKPAGEQLKRVKVPRFQSFLNISYILLFLSV